jgi:hypothetical protein
LRQSHVVLQRRPGVGRRQQDVLEVARHDADDRVAVAVERDWPADDREICGEATLPEPVAQHHDLGPVDTIVDRLEIPAERRRHAEHAEVARADHLTVEPLRLGRPGHGRLPRPHDGRRHERSPPFGRLEERAVAHLAPCKIDILVPHHHHAVGSGIRQRLKEHRLYGAEDGRARADAERESEDANGGQTRRLRELPQREANVLPQLMKSFAESHVFLALRRRLVELLPRRSERRAAESTNGLGACVGRRHPRRDQSVRARIEEACELVIDVGVDVRRCAQETAKDAAKHGTPYPAVRVVSTVVSAST